MDRFAKLVSVLALAFAGSASAGYANLSPPPGWSSGGGGAYGTIPARFGSAAANSASAWSASTVANVGGRSITIPAAGRFAANAGRFAARGLMLNPLALGVAGAAWFAEQCIAYKNGGWEYTCGGGAPPEKATGYEYRVNANHAFQTSPSAACKEWVPTQNSGYWSYVYVGVEIGGNGSTADCIYKQAFDGGTPFNGRTSMQSRASQVCPAGWYITDAGCVQTPQPTKLTPEEVEEKMAPKTVPPEVWPLVPPNTPIPIGPPSINPTAPPDLTPQPLIVPQGDPVPVPNSNPRRWTQPEIQITPAPSPDSPWRVDIKPQDRPVGDPLTNPPIRNPYTPPVVNPGNPDAPPVEPDPLKDPVPTTPDLCEKYPDILACQVPKLGELEAQKINNTEVPLKIEKESGFPSGGQCPAPKVVALMGKSFSFTIEPLCDFAKAIKPLLLGFAYLTAALTFLGVARRE